MANVDEDGTGLEDWDGQPCLEDPYSTGLDAASSEAGNFKTSLFQEESTFVAIRSSPALQSEAEGHASDKASAMEQAPCDKPEVITLDDDEQEEDEEEVEILNVDEALQTSGHAQLHSPSLRDQLREQVMRQLLKEPGERASVGRLVTQPPLTKIMSQLSKCEQLPMTGMPSFLCELLRASPEEFTVAAAKRQHDGDTGEQAPQDLKVSLTEFGKAEAKAAEQKADTSASTQDSGHSGPRTTELPDQPALQNDEKVVPEATRWVSQKDLKTHGSQASATETKDILGKAAISRSATLKQAAKEFTTSSGRHVDWAQSWKQKQKSKPAYKHVAADGPRPPEGPPPKQLLDARDAAHHRAQRNGDVSNRPNMTAAKRNADAMLNLQANGGSSIGSGPNAVDNEGRPFDFQHVVVNFANVGATFGEKVLRRNKTQTWLFDYEGVRRCVKHLKEKRGLSVIGVVFENFRGADNGKEVFAVPRDINAMCESIQLTPRLTGQNHRSADDEMTIKCAYRRNCRLLDNDNYQDWQKYLADETARTWLQRCQEFLQMRYYFDSGLGEFDTLDGNIPAHLLAQGRIAQPDVKQHNKKRR